MIFGPAPAPPLGRPAGARARILWAAYDLFGRRGIRDVGVDELVRASDVAKATFYRHFRSKDEVALAYLGQWYEERSATIEEAVARSGPGDPTAAVLAVFDAFEDWFRQGAVQVSCFPHVMMEMGSGHPLGRASIAYMARTREQIAGLAASAGLPDPAGFAWNIHILLKGAIVAAAEGDRRAAERAKDMAALLITHDLR
ncbi:TetR/AcrR family transcriptional regulator [Sinomonas sp.]|jgi:AcrR family transcriptional regulator|uniref:TetR/AcrR family transcriptional regulator n=1 Tax=Sinomonas sp. TaxID=1914986 RepID=UPI002FE06B60